MKKNCCMTIGPNCCQGSNCCWLWPSAVFSVTTQQKQTKQLSVLQMCHTCVAAVRKTTMIWTQVSKFPENSIKLCACDCAEEGCVEITHTAVSWQEATCGVKYFNICVFLPERNKVKEGDAASISQKIYIRTIPTFQFDTPVWAALCLSLTHLSPPQPHPPCRPSPRQLHARPLSCRRPCTSSPGRSQWPPFLLPVVPRLKIKLPVVEVPRGSRLLLRGRLATRAASWHTR